MGGGGGSCIPDTDYRPGALQWLETATTLGEHVPVTKIEKLWCACGLSDDKLEVRITLPDGEVVPIQALVFDENDNPNKEQLDFGYYLTDDPEFSDIICANIMYKVGLGSVLGDYQITLFQDGLTITDEFKLIMPEEPDAVWTDEGAWLTGFKPRELIRLLIYAVKYSDGDYSIYDIDDDGVFYYKFMGEHWIEADQYGSLIASFGSQWINNHEIQVIAIDEEGNIVSTNTIEMSYLNTGTADNHTDLFLHKICTDQQINALPPRLRLGGKALVLQENLSIFSENYIELYDEIASLRRNIIVDIIDGPTCNIQEELPPSWSWKIRTGDNVTGWVVEADPFTYYLEPME
jgi:hypothetical protein